MRGIRRVLTAGVLGVAVVLGGCSNGGADTSEDTIGSSDRDNEAEPPEPITFAEDEASEDVAGLYQNLLVQTEVVCTLGDGTVPNPTGMVDQEMLDSTDLEATVPVIELSLDRYNTAAAEMGDGLPEGYPESLDWDQEADPDFCGLRSSMPTTQYADPYQR